MEEADIVIIIGDRIEMLFEALQAWFIRKPILHIYGGVVTNITLYDDYIRHIITILSSSQIVESKKCRRVVKKLLKSIGLIPNITILPNNKHLQGINLDESLVPKEPYNLVLYNPTTKIKEIFIGSNPDEYYINLPREQFLGLLANCKKFITNSSSMVYEAPHFLKKKQIIRLGKRNRSRKCKR